MKYVLAVLLVCLCTAVHADESDIIKADRQALADAQASGDSSRIMAAKEQLSDDLSSQSDQLREAADGVSIPLTPDGQGHLIADVLINNSVHASLIVDTGSPVVMLSSSFMAQLGVDPSQTTLGYVEVLNGRHRAAAVSLDRVQIGDAQAQNVNGVVLLDGYQGMADGLLGMSFLSKFHFTLDQEGQKLILRKP